MFRQHPTCRNYDQVARRPNHASRDRQVGFPVRVSGRIRSDDGSDRATASGRRDDKEWRPSSLERGIDAKNPEGLHADFGAQLCRCGLTGGTIGREQLETANGGCLTLLKSSGLPTTGFATGHFTGKFVHGESSREVRG